MQRKHETASDEPMTWENGGYWGVCPRCRRNDGYINAGRSHWFFCKEHRVKWCVGANLFSSWRHETEAEQRRVYDEIGLGEFEQIEPLGLPEPRRTDTQSEQRAKYPDHHPDDDEMPF